MTIGYGGQRGLAYKYSHFFYRYPLIYRYAITFYPDFHGFKMRYIFSVLEDTQNFIHNPTGM